MRLSHLIVTTSLLCVAGAGVALAFDAGDSGSKGKPAEGGAVFPVVPTNAGYVGNTECKTCHPTIWANFYKNPHFKSMA